MGGSDIGRKVRGRRKGKGEEKERKKRAAANDDRELKREEDKLRKRGLKGIELRREMVEINDRIVRRRLRLERERFDKETRDRNGWPRKFKHNEEEKERKEREERRRKDEQEEKDRKEREEKRRKEDEK